MLRFPVAKKTPSSRLKFSIPLLMALVWKSSIGQTNCKPPFDLSPSQPNDSTISLNWSQWSAGNSSTYYYAELREAGTGTWTPAEFLYGYDHEYCIYTQAANGKCYEWRVRTICISPAGEKDTTAWSTTVYCAQPVKRACEAPDGLSTKMDSDTTGELSWTQIPNSGLKYQVEIREYNSMIWSPVGSSYSVDYAYSVDTLVILGKCYEWRIRAICPASSFTSDTSVWASIILNTGVGECVNSTTISGCEPPASLSASMANNSTAALTWTQLLTGSGGLIYDAEYRELPLTAWTKAYFPYGNDAELAWIRNAKIGSCYEWRARTICYSGNNTDTSAWVYITQNTGAASCPSPPPLPPAVTVNPDFTYVIDPCSPRRVSFSNTTTVSGALVKSIEWDLGDNTKATSNQPVHVYQKPGTYQVTLSILDNSGKTYQKTSTLIARDLPRFANAGNDKALCTADTISLQASGGESYSWSPCLDLTNCRIANPKVFPGTSRDYIVTVTNKDGCIDSDTVSVKFRDPAIKLYVPTAFTPNNDGINDLFRPLISLPLNVGAEWKLFNRFGNLVFSANNNTSGWNGSYKGQPQPSGNYTYVINLRAENNCPARQYKGTVLLMR